MKKLFFIMLALMCASIMYGQKRVAVVPPTATEGVAPIDVSIVRGKLVQYISAMQGYEAFTRNDIDQIVDQIIIEMDLQRSGMLNEANRKTLGTLQGADLILVSTLTYGKGRLNVEASLLNIETGTIEKSVSQVINPEIPEDMERACKMLAEQLIGVYSTNNLAGQLIGVYSTNNNVPNKNNTKLEGVIIDGITWATTNIGAINPEYDGKYYTWMQAETACPNGWRLPAKTEFEKLKNLKKTGSCVLTTQNGKNGLKLGDNNNHIFLPATGYRGDFGLRFVGKSGSYWSTESSNFSAYFFSFWKSSMAIGNYDKTTGRSVRCVKE